MPETAETVAAVRRFTRFYTRAVGVLDRAYLGGPYTVTESRVLYEIAHQRQDGGGGVTPKAIGGVLGLDPGYLSRMVAKFERDGLVGRTRSAADGRSVVLALTEQGRAYFARMDARSAALVARLVDGLSSDGQAKLTGALGEAQGLLARDTQAEVILRPHRTGDMGWVTERHGVLYGREYGWPKLESVTARIVADFLDNFDPERERCWIAERGGERLGSVFLVKETDEVARLRLLMLEPQARGLRLGRRLVDECLAFARAAGYREVVLWTHQVLTAARAIYAAVGFQIEETWVHDEFGAPVVSETWRLKL